MRGSRPEGDYASALDRCALTEPGALARRAGVRAMLVFLLQLAACGGGGDSAPAPPVVANPAPPAPPVAVGAVPAGYQLVWADEFDVAGLPDAARWAYDTERNRLGWYNNELQYYAAARTENSQVSGGRLRITARLESLGSAGDWGGQRYSISNSIKHQ